MKSRQIILAVSECGSRKNGVAPMVYAYLIVGEKDAHWGYAAERDTQLMAGRGITRAINELDAESDGEDRIEIIASKPGFEKFFKEHVPKWIREDLVESKHGGLEWKESTLVAAICNGQVRKPTSQSESALETKVRKFAREHVRKLASKAFAENRSLYEATGTILTDEAENAPALPVRLA